MSEGFSIYEEIDLLFYVHATRGWLDLSSLRQFVKGIADLLGFKAGFWFQGDNIDTFFASAYDPVNGLENTRLFGSSFFSDSLFRSGFFRPSANRSGCTLNVRW